MADVLEPPAPITSRLSPWLFALRARVYQQAHPWFCIPHAASDDWVTGFATLLLNTLRPDLRVYIEYSNEVWNNGFPQYTHAAAMGQQLGLASVAADAAVRYHKLRSLQVGGSLCLGWWCGGVVV